MKFPLFIIIITVISGCNSPEGRIDANRSGDKQKDTVFLTLQEAERLAELPLKCMIIEFPNKLNQTLGGSDEIGSPKELHPAFYGCFDWHSSVHGHWMLVKLIKMFPELSQAEQIKKNLLLNINPANIAGEIEYFSRKSETGYERTYGWAWLLKLAEELHTWDDPIAKELENSLQPLTELIVDRYIEFLPMLLYPIRVGEHTNSAFGLSLAYGYSETLRDTVFKSVIEKRAMEFYSSDSGCPYGWEPSGYDFLSPCLEEAELMRKIMPEKDFKLWLSRFYPDLFDKEFLLNPAQVSDRNDGKLVHLDGLNFSRAWCLYGLSNSFKELSHLRSLADSHMRYSLKGISDGGYEGEHWLASFAVYALAESGKYVDDTR